MTRTAPFATHGSAPLYRAIRSNILQRLSQAEWRVGEPIPSESRLAEMFGVSIGTVRKAVDELVAEKILIRHQGRGTYVAPHTENHTLYHFFHVVRAGGTREFPESQLLAFGRARADAEIARQLRIERGARVLQIANLLKLRGQPVVLDRITVADAMFPGLTEEIFRRRENTIYGLYQSRFGINVVRAVERLSATTSGGEEARVLALRPGAPVLEIHRVAYTYHDQPVEVRLSRVNTEGFEYLNDLGKPEQA